MTSSDALTALLAAVGILAMLDLGYLWLQGRRR